VWNMVKNSMTLLFAGRRFADPAKGYSQLALRRHGTLVIADSGDNRVLLRDAAA